MIGGFRSEVVKLRRLSMFIAPITMVGLMALAVYFGFERIHHRPDAFIYILGLEQANGLVVFLSHGADLLLLISILVIAGAVGEEWTRGTLRNLLVFEPRRLQFLLGKSLALLLFVAIGCALATIVGTAIGYMVAPAVGIATAPWSSSVGIQDYIHYLGNFAMCLIAWTVFGILLGVVFRSAAAAIGVALGYFFVFDGLVALLLPDVGKWLFGQMTEAMLSGGSSTVSYHTAIIGSWIYVGIMVIITAVIFRLRDVTA